MHDLTVCQTKIGGVLGVETKNQVIENMEVMLLEIMKGARPQKDVQNADRSGWLLENKGAKKVLWMS